MQTSKLFTLLPEEWVATPDGMTIDKNGDLILSCPNFANMDLPSCVLRITPDKKITKWFDLPVNPATGEGRCMGLEFGPDGDLYIVDNAGWTGREDLIRTGRILRVHFNEAGEYESFRVVADGMEHPNGLRIRGDYIYVTQSTLELVKTPSGKLMSCVYCFRLDDENIHVTNTLEDENILCTFITENPLCQYGVDGIVFDREGRLIIGNFGDGSVWRLDDRQGTVVLRPGKSQDHRRHDHRPARQHLCGRLLRQRHRQNIARRQDHPHRPVAGLHRLGRRP